MSSARDAVLRYGANTTSFQVLEPGYTFFPYDDGVIAYVDTGLAWVAAGDPLTRPEVRVDAAISFCAAARRARRVPCLFATEGAFVQAAQAAGFSSILLGEQPVFDPSAWTSTLRARSSLREQLRRARAKGVRVRRVAPHTLGADAPLGRSVRALLRRWLATRKMAEMGFLVQLDAFDDVEHKVCYVAEREGVLVGYLGVVPIPARHGWFLEDLVRERTAPNGTAEALIDACMRDAAGADVRMATLGLAPLSGNIGTPLVRIRDATRFLYDFRGLRRFKEKLGPRAFEPVYMTYPSAQSAFVSTVAGLHAFAKGGFVVFGLRTLSRRPRLLALACLAVALVVAAVWALAA